VLKFKSHAHNCAQETSSLYDSSQKCNQTTLAMGLSPGGSTPYNRWSKKELVGEDFARAWREDEISLFVALIFSAN